VEAKPDPMSEPRVQRTLVKSPPELWAEISDVGTLARHLGELGEIRITRLENETTVVWEGDRACGTVELEASGWGTKVTITAAAVEADEPEPEPAAVIQAAPEPVALAEPEPVAVAEPEPEPEPELAQVTESLAVLELDSAPEEPRRGFFARLFRRRAAATAPAAEPKAVAEPVVAPDPEPVAEPVAVLEPEPVATVEPAPEPVAITESAREPEPAPPAVEPFDDARLEAVLVGVLDDLGAAHHRPFSRG
jgi:hypothetical protein